MRRIAIYHITPALILSFTMLLLVSGVIRLFKIEEARLRGILFFVALLKPLVVLIRGTFPLPYSIYAPVAINLQLPDPMDFIPAHLWHIETHPGKIDIYATDINMCVSLILILAVAGIFLFWRWRSYYLFCKDLSRQSSFAKDEDDKLSDIFARLQEKIPARVRLLITREKYESPFSIGVKNPLMVCPFYILAHLTSEEKEAVLAHEFLHIQKKDTLWQWIPVILKDLLLFSPFAYLSFMKVCLEREKKVDRAVAKLLSDSKPLASALLKTAKLMSERKKSLPMHQSFFTQKFLAPGKSLTERIKPLIDFKAISDERMSRGKRILMGFIVFLLLYPQVFIHIRVFFYKIQIF
ncbi:hypothetical protein IBX65_06700 [Candidatus Aerophobetes bacterium]|nr:hypothetical protein [Candidatus Aerophobetes bacterium]